MWFDLVLFISMLLSVLLSGLATISVVHRHHAQPDRQAAWVFLVQDDVMHLIFFLGASVFLFSAQGLLIFKFPGQTQSIAQQHSAVCHITGVTLPWTYFSTGLWVCAVCHYTLRKATKRKSASVRKKLAEDLSVLAGNLPETSTDHKSILAAGASRARGPLVHLTVWQYHFLWVCAGVIAGLYYLLCRYSDKRACALECATSACVSLLVPEVIILSGCCCMVGYHLYHRHKFGTRSWCSLLLKGEHKYYIMSLVGLFLPNIVMRANWIISADNNSFLFDTSKLTLSAAGTLGGCYYFFRAFNNNGDFVKTEEVEHFVLFEQIHQEGNAAQWREQVEERVSLKIKQKFELLMPLVHQAFLRVENYKDYPAKWPQQLALVMAHDRDLEVDSLVQSQDELTEFVVAWVAKQRRIALELSLARSRPALASSQ